MSLIKKGAGCAKASLSSAHFSLCQKLLVSSSHSLPVRLFNHSNAE